MLCIEQHKESASTLEGLVRFGFVWGGFALLPTLSNTEQFMDHFACVCTPFLHLN